MRSLIQTFALLLVLISAGCAQRAPVADDDDTSAGDDDDTAPSDDDDTAPSDDDDTAPGDDDDSTAAPAFSIQCMPATQQLAITWGNPTSVQFSAEIIWPDGTVEDPTSATWSVLANFGGSVSADGLYTTPSDHGGVGQIQVRQQGIDGLCEVAISIDGQINNTADSAVPGAFSSAGVVVDDNCAAQLLYPLDDAVIPGSLLPPKIQWFASGGSNMYSVRLHSDYSDLTFFTNDEFLSPDQATWQGLTTFDPGTLVEITLVSGNWTGSSFSGTPCTASSSVTIEASDNDLDGTVVYWGASAAGGMRTLGVGATSPTPLALPAMTCVGCHTVNLSNPSLMSYSDFSPMSPGRIVNLSNPSAVVAGPLDSVFTTLDPTGTRGVKAPMFGFGSIFGGRQLTLIELPSEMSLGTLPTSGTPSFADWSPDGSKLVYSSCSEGSTEFGAQGCSLRIMDVSGDVFTNDRLLLQNQGDENLYYPTFSPDSQWIAFNKGGHFTGTDANGDPNSNSSSYANPTARLFIISANGGDAVELAAANGVGDLTNSWPRWAPVTQDYAWLAYSSKRDYGHSGQGNSQLWITAVDLSEASLGNDPSAPPVWFTGQDLGENNLIPVWVPRIAF